MPVKTKDNFFFKENGIYTTTSYEGDDIFLSALLNLYDVYFDYCNVELGNIRDWYFDYDKSKLAILANEGNTPEQILNYLWKEYVNEIKILVDDAYNDTKNASHDFMSK